MAGKAENVSVKVVTGYMYSIILYQLIERYHSYVKCTKVNENTSASSLL